MGYQKAVVGVAVHLHEEPKRVERYPGAWAAQTPDRTAVISADASFTRTFAQLDEAANRVSRLLRSKGVEPGDAIAILMDNDPRLVELVWGCHYAGAMYTMISSRLTSAEVSHILVDSGARVLLTAHRFAALLEALPATSRPPVTFMLGGSTLTARDLEKELAPLSSAALDEERVAGMSMLYSSGTSGVPKAVARPFVDRPLETAPIGSSYAARSVFGMSEQSTYLNCAPLYHSGPLGMVMGASALGATVVLLEKFAPENFLSAVADHRVTHSFVVPTMMSRMMKLPEDRRLSFDTSSLQSLIHSAAPCPVPLKKAMIAWLGPVIDEFYAGTEANAMVFCTSEEWLAHEGTVGRPVGCEVHICDDDNTPLPIGETGTVFFDGGIPFEYRNDAEKTAASRSAEGWATLGDVGHLDEDGFLYLTDRRSNMIISGGVNIYPQEVENLLSGHPLVADVAVIGIPDDDFGEQVLAVVQPETVPQDDCERDTWAAELIAFCRQNLADLKCPRRVEFRAELPREPTGKLIKRRLTDEFWADRSTRI